jgi:F420-dependent oxidoreductase-like protein
VSAGLDPEVRSEGPPVPQPLRFGLVRNQNLPWETLLRHFRHFEALGFDSAWPCDHFQRPSIPGAPYLEGWTLLAALAALTSRIRLGLLVTSNTFRHPSLLAKQAVTLDHVSNGRLELGLGTGWYVPEHERFGLRFPPAPERVERFREAVALLHLLMTRDVTTYEGRYYQVREAPFRPGPVQRPRPPLTLGAHGPKMLRVVAEYADRWNSYGTTEQIRERNARLDDACAAVGRDPETITRSLYGWTLELGVDPWQSPAAFEDVVGRYREVGIGEFLMEAPDEAQFGVLERVATDVLPRLRAGG